MGNTTFYGPDMIVDTTQKITVVTQFLTSDGTDSGTLSEIRRFYVQNGVTIPNSQSTIAGVTGNSITDSFCDAQKTAFGDTNTFKTYGALEQLGAAFQQGMVLVLSIWDDYAVDMLWLDSDYPTTADPTSSPGCTWGRCARGRRSCRSPSRCRGAARTGVSSSTRSCPPSCSTRSPPRSR